MPTTESIRFWRPANLEGVEVCHVRDLPESQSHFLGRYLIAMYPREHAEARYRRWHSTLTDGAVQLCEPGELIRCTKQHQPWSGCALFVDSAVIAAAAQDLGGSGTVHFATPVTWDRKTYTALTTLHRSLLDDALALAQQSVFAEVVRVVLERYAEQRASEPLADKPAVARAREYLHAHWSEGVHLDALARAACLSKYELVRQFKAQIGLPPHQYLLQLRLTKARGMIAGGTPISRAAAECGFSAQSHLHRHFVRSLGVTPGQYQRSVA